MLATYAAASSETRLGYIWKFLETLFYKRFPKMESILAILTISLLMENCCSNFVQTFGDNNWATFYSGIWSHCPRRLCYFSVKLRRCCAHVDMRTLHEL